MSDINELKEKVEVILGRVEKQSTEPICLAYVTRFRKHCEKSEHLFVDPSDKLRDPALHTACGFSTDETTTICQFLDLWNEHAQARLKPLISEPQASTAPHFDSAD